MHLVSRTVRRACSSLPAIRNARFFHPSANVLANKKVSPQSTIISSPKESALLAALKQIESDHGKGTVMKMGVDQKPAQLEVISTGSLSLDLALGVGGIPKGRIIEIFGPEASGKTTLALHCIAEAQKKGGVCTFIDAEHALDPVYASKVGVQLSNMYISQPDCGEQALEIADTLVRSGGVDIVVVDSVAALVPRAEIEGEMGDAHMAQQARLMSQALRKLTASVAKTDTTMIFINQVRHKLGVAFGNPETTTGGNALKFYSSVRVDIRRIASIKKNEDVIGNRVKCKVAKNKVAPPFRVVEFDIIFGKGINRAGELLDMGLKCGVLSKSGTQFLFNDHRLGVGREKARTFLEQNPSVAGEIEAEIRKKVADDGFGGVEVEEGAEEDVKVEAAEESP
eukprot:GILI01003725.1.p1 GENE.GILI01003725.1~~GILI01003725.1.p1  ORF type:complete len:397 (-),score=126.90 GILI01003725.1:323-1513(-)